MSRDIDDLDFNSLRSKIIETIGPGTGTFGYGQEIKSSPVYEGNLITKVQWDGLRYDIINILFHQNGVTPDIIEVAKGQQVRLADTLQAYDGLIQSARNSRFLLAASQSTSTLVANKTLTTRWNTYAYTTVRLTFSTEDEARFFFNSGGKIRFSSSRSGGSSTAQNGAWTNVLTNAGIIEFGAASTGLNFYQLTNSYKTLFQRALSTPYSANVYRIQALCNVSNNNSGSATSVTFEITWTDNYSETFPNTTSPPEDQVDGTLSLAVEEVKASGLLQPTGNFAITSPSYEIENIIGGYDAPPPPPPPPPPAAPPPPPPPVPPPVVTYNEIVSVPSTVGTYETFRGTITGGAPNTDFSVEWKTSSGRITSSGTNRLDGSGNFDSGTTGVFAEPDTYILTVRFSYTGNVVVKTTTVVAPTYRETVIVTSSLNIGGSVTVLIRNGVPNSVFGYSLRNSAGEFIISASFFTLDGSGDFYTTLPTAGVPSDTYTHFFGFIATGNNYYKTTVLR